MVASAPPRLLLPLALLVMLCIAAVASLPTASVDTAHQRITMPPWPLSANPRLWPALDQMFERLSVDANGELRPDNRTAPALQRVADTIEEPLVPLERQRIRMLATHSLPGTAGDDAYHLLMHYLAYLAALATLPDSTDLAARQHLQQQYLDEKAAILFQQENAMLEALQAGAQ